MHLSGVKIKSSISRVVKSCMSLTTMVYPLLQLRFAQRTEVVLTIALTILFRPLTPKTKNKKDPGTGRGAGCCIVGGDTLGSMSATHLAWHHHPLIAKKRPNARKTMKLLPDSSFPKATVL